MTFWAALVAAIRQRLCALRGHDALPEYAPDRIFLRCYSCGHESSGWDLNAPRPVRMREKLIRFRQRLAV